MKIASTLAFLLVFASGALAAAQLTSAPAVYIAPANGFQTSLAAAMGKKQVPISLSTDESAARYRLEASPLKVKTQTTGSKVVRCLLADCIGIQDSSTVSVQLVDISTKRVVWAYSVHKQWGSSMNDQSMAEAVAKHLKQYLQKHPLGPNPPTNSPTS